jgi:N-acetylmuramoyl-L-alanine amidase
MYSRGVALDRGVKSYRPNMRGGLSLISGKAPAVLVEPFFGDSRLDAELAAEIGQRALANVYVDGVAEAFGQSVSISQASGSDFDLAHMM